MSKSNKRPHAAADAMDFPSAKLARAAPPASMSTAAESDGEDTSGFEVAPPEPEVSADEFNEKFDGVGKGSGDNESDLSGESSLEEEYRDERDDAFGEVDSAGAAIADNSSAKANDQPLKSKKKRVRDADGAELHAARFILFLGSLPYDATREMVMKHFSCCGEGTILGENIFGFCISPIELATNCHVWIPPGEPFSLHRCMSMSTVTKYQFVILVSSELRLLTAVGETRRMADGALQHRELESRALGRSLVLVWNAVWTRETRSMHVIELPVRRNMAARFSPCKV